MRRKISARITDQDKEFILANYKGTSCQRMGEILEEKFGGRHSKTQMEAFYHRYDLHSGLTGQFKKGNIPHTKGKHQTDYLSPEALERVKRGWYKKGNHTGVASVTYPIGTIHHRNDGYDWIKVGEPSIWQEYHRYVWEQHNGKLGADKKILHLDNNLTNNNIDNLVIVDDGVMAIVNNHYKLTTDVELNKVIIKLAELRTKIYRSKNEL